MARFMTRVELHGANAQDYTNLHTYMMEAKFQITIQGSDGKIYRLPPAEYYFEGTATRDQVLQNAKYAAQRTIKSSAIVVSETVASVWSGLSEVQPARRFG